MMGGLDRCSQVILRQTCESDGSGKKTEEGAALAKKIKSACPSKGDEFAATWLEGAILSGCNLKGPAAKKYLELMEAHPYPALVIGVLNCALDAMGNAPEMAATAQKWVKEFKGAQNMVPGLLLRLGQAELRAKRTTELSKIRGILGNKFAASSQRDILED